MSIKESLFELIGPLSNNYGRDRWVKEKLQILPKNSEILDAGAGLCTYKKWCTHLNYTSQDFNEYSGAGDGSGLQTGKWDTSGIDIVSDITAIPVKDKTFDCILCTEVLEHIPYPDRAIIEFSRILKPGGTLILTVPFCSQTHFAPYHFSTGFNRYYLERVLEDNDFKVLEIKYNGNYFDYIGQELLRTPLVSKRYSVLSYLSYAMYLFVLPLVFIMFVLSKLSKNSEKQLTFGFHVCAQKIK